MIINILKHGNEKLKEIRSVKRFKSSGNCYPNRPLLIATVNFWKTAFKNDFLDYLLTRVTDGNHEYVRRIEQADIIFSSVFGSKKSDPHRTIFYTGENIRPDFKKCAYSLSFEQDSWVGRNFYTPFWYSRIAWPGFITRGPTRKKDRPHLYENLIEVESLTSARQAVSFQDRNRFCAIIASNPETLRLNLARELSAYKPVDGYGRAFGEPLHASKFDTLKKYRFCLCPENDIWPGYVTEKLFDAWAAGTIPIYCGLPNKDSELNRDAYVNYLDFMSAEEVIRRVVELDSNEDLFNRTYTKPLLLKPPRLEPLVHFLRESIESILKNAGHTFATGDALEE